MPPGSASGTCALRAQVPATSLQSSRRRFLFAAGSALPLLAPPSAVQADSTGKFSSKRTAKNRYVPRIKKGVAALQAGDSEAFAATLDDMVSAMKLYGQANRRGELPDKISQRLEALAEAFGKVAKGGDEAATAAALQQYFDALPRDGKEPFGNGLAPAASD